MKSNCDAKAQLLMAYQKATTAYSQAVFELSRAVGMASYINYPVLREEAAAAREISERARGELEKHIREHGC